MFTFLWCFECLGLCHCPFITHHKHQYPKVQKSLFEISLRHSSPPNESLFLKDSNLVPLLVSDVFVDGEDEHEHKEEAGTTKDVPDVMPVINSW